MKSNKIYLSLLMGVALLTSCSKGSNEPTDGGEGVPAQRMTFSAELPNPNAGGDELRTRLDSDGHTVLWTKGTDQISVFAYNQPTQNRAFTATQVLGSEATFEGEAAQSPHYYALYPYDAAATFNRTNATFTTTLQTHQRAVLGSYADQASPAVAVLQSASETNRRFKFKNATGMLKIHFTFSPDLEDTAISEIRLMAKPDAQGNLPKLSGKASIVAGVGTDRPRTTIDKATGVPYISLSNGGAALEPTTDDQAYYMLVPTEGTGLSFSLIFTTADGRGVVKDIQFTSPFASNRIKTVKLYIESLEQHLLTNIPLLDAIDAQLTKKFVREADRSVDYFKNMEQITSARIVRAVNNNELNSLRELPYFVNAREIIFDGLPNLKGELVIDQNPALTTINIQRTGFTSASIKNIEQIQNGVHMSNNSALTYVEVEGSNVTNISLNSNPNLSSVNLSKVPALKGFSAFYSGLTALDFSQNPELEGFNIHANKVQRLDLSKNPKIKSIVASNNRITEVDLSQSPLVTEINLHYNPLKKLDLSHNLELTNLGAAASSITELDLSRNAKLVQLNVHSSGGLKSITFPADSKLENLGASSTSLTSLDLTTTKALKEINVSYSRGLKTIIGLESLSALAKLNVSLTALETLSVFGSPLLYELDAYGCKLAELDITQNPLLLKVATNRLYAGTQTYPGGNIARTITVRMTANQRDVFTSSGLVNDNKNKDNVSVVVP